MTELTTTVHAATLFSDRARIARRGQISLEPGLQQIAIPNLPLTLDPTSVRARASGLARARLLGVDVRKTYFKDTPPGRAQELAQNITALEEQDQELADRLETLEHQILHLDSLLGDTKPFAASLARGRATPEAHAAFLDFVERRRAENASERRATAMQRRELNKELEKLRKELQQIQAARPKERYTAFVELDVVQAGSLEIELIYMQTGAHWQPMYDARLLDGNLQITYLGQISQASGEDWENVGLALSTAAARLAGIAPELEPWYITSEADKPILARGRGQPLAAAAVAPAAAMPAGLEKAGEVEEVAAEQASVESTEASVTYTIRHRADIPGDNSPRKLTIAEFSLKPEFAYVAAPRLVQAAYRRVKSINESAFLLLPGPVQLFEGDDYLGRTRVTLVSPGQEFELYFGVDERISVKRELIRRETDKKFIGDARRIRFAFEIRLENYAQERQRILVCDQIPVSRNESIKVRLESSEPKPSTQDELNRLEWDIVLAPGGKQNIRFDFSVEAPRDMPVYGLP